METEHYSQPLLSQKNGSQPQSLPLIYTSQPYENDEDEVELGSLFAVARRKALMIAGVTIALMSAALLWAISRPPTYEGRFQLLVEPLTPNDGQLTGPSSLAKTLLGGNLDIEEAGLDYETQIAVLRSPKVMSRVVEQMQARYPDLSYNSLIRAEKLKVERFQETKIIEVSYADTDPQKTQYVVDQVARAYIQYSLQERQTNLGQGIKFVDQQLPRVRQQVDQLQGQIQRFRQRHQLIDLDIQSERLSGRTSDLEEQQLAAQSELDEANSLYARLQQQLALQPNQAIASSALAQAPRYQNLLDQLQEVESQIATESARYREANPAIQNLQDQRQNLLPLLDQEAQRVLGKKVLSSTASLGAQIPEDSIRQELAQQYVDTANQIRVLQVRRQAIAQAKNLLDQQVQQLPVVGRQFTDLERELKVATDTLNQLLVRREALRIDDAQQEVPWELLSAPEIPRDRVGQPVPESRHLLLFLAVGAILGLLSGYGAALITEMLNGVFQTPEEVKTKTGLAALGLIPIDQAVRQPLSAAKLDEQKLLLEQRHNPSPFSEAFDALSTHVRFLHSERLSRSLVVSSAMPRDGKSTVALHLAWAAAEMGQRVLLVDADLRHPQVQTRLNLPNSQGLTTLAATDVEVRSVIQRSAHVANLFVLTAGQAASNSTVLLGSKEMQGLMQQLQAEFDLVIYDTPSILGSTDTSLIAPYADGVILVVRMGQTNRSRTMLALDRLKAVHAQVLGFVANGVKQQPISYGSNGSGGRAQTARRAMSFFN